MAAFRLPPPAFSRAPARGGAAAAPSPRSTARRATSTPIRSTRCRRSPGRSELADPLRRRADVPGAIGSDRIVMKPSPIQVTLLGDGRWVEPAPAHIRNLLTRSFANTGRFAFVSSASVGPLPDFTLMTDVEQLRGRAPARGRRSRPGRGVDDAERGARRRRPAVASRRFSADRRGGGHRRARDRLRLRGGERRAAPGGRALGERGDDRGGGGLAADPVELGPVPPHRLERLPVALGGRRRWRGRGRTRCRPGAWRRAAAASEGWRPQPAAATMRGAEQDGVLGRARPRAAGGVGVELHQQRVAGVAAGDVQRLDAHAVGAQRLEDVAEAERDGDAVRQ